MNRTLTSKVIFILLTFLFFPSTVNAEKYKVVNFLSQGEQSGDGREMTIDFLGQLQTSNIDSVTYNTWFYDENRYRRIEGTDGSNEVQILLLNPYKMVLHECTTGVTMTKKSLLAESELSKTTSCITLDESGQKVLRTVSVHTDGTRRTEIIGINPDSVYKYLWVTISTETQAGKLTSLIKRTLNEKKKK